MGEPFFRKLLQNLGQFKNKNFFFRFFLIFFGSEKLATIEAFMAILKILAV